MIAVVSPSRLCGSVRVPASKSYAHRLLIAAALSDAPTRVSINARSRDIDATADCLRALGVRVQPLNDAGVQEQGFSVYPLAERMDQPTLFCAESGSTLRFMLPVAAALGTEATFTGEGRLPERPNEPLIEALRSHGVTVDRELLPIRLSGRLTGGDYPIAGNISSQYITGLMLALPLCKEDSHIILTTPLESAGYLDITREVLSLFGVRVEVTPQDFFIPGGQTYNSPQETAAEGDWSGAAFWLAARRMGHEVEVNGLNPESAQGDRAIVEQLTRLGQQIDVSGTPDAVPALAVAAAMHPGVTRITGAARLRIKESDRLRAVSDMLRALGGQVEEQNDGLIIRGGAPLHGGRVEGYNDHRIVMAAAIAASMASGPVEITDAQAINKSYPGFFRDFESLGGNVHVQ